MKCVIQTPLGPMLLEERSGRVAQLRFVSADEGRTLPPPETELAKRTAAWLRAYFAGEHPTADLPLAADGTAFQQRVWQACREVPYGETRSYGELARRIGCGSARAVGGALGKNPIWLLIPCHRIVGSGGDLTGYAGGLDKKAALLRLEKNR